MRRTDITPAFVRMLRADGHEADVLDPLTDDLDRPRARGAVRRRLGLGLAAPRAARGPAAGAAAGSPPPRAPGGLLHLAVKEGDGARFSTHGHVGAPRHFTFWREEPLRAVLEAAGWGVDDVHRRRGLRAATWLGGAGAGGHVRHTEFWARMEQALGPAYARAWAEQFVIGELGGRTADEALDAGVPPKQVWAAVWRALELPPRER